MLMVISLAYSIFFTVAAPSPSCQPSTASNSPNVGNRKRSRRQQRRPTPRFSDVNRAGRSDAHLGATAREGRPLNRQHVSGPEEVNYKDDDVNSASSMATTRLVPWTLLTRVGRLEFQLIGARILSIRALWRPFSLLARKLITCCL